jgi:hypothetical protein
MGYGLPQIVIVRRRDCGRVPTLMRIWDLNAVLAAFSDAAVDPAQWMRALAVGCNASAAPETSSKFKKLA